MPKRKNDAPCPPAVRAIRERNEEARKAALEEIQELRKDLAALERILANKQKPGDFSAFDLAHSAFELFRLTTSILDNEALAASMEAEVERARAEDALARAGATLLTRPAGWHWFSPAGEMHFLGKAHEPEKAADKLAKLIEVPRKKPAAAPAEPAAPAAPAAEERTPAPAEPAAPARKAAAKAARA